MNKTLLKPNLQIRGIVIFLNILGLVVEKLSAIDWSSKIKVFSVKGDEVGYICFSDGKVVVDTIIFLVS